MANMSSGGLAIQCAMFLVDDMSDARVFLLENGLDDGIYKIGSGIDMKIRELAETVMSVVGFTGKIVFESSKTDGTPRKSLNVSCMTSLGWKKKTKLRDAIASVN